MHTKNLTIVIFFLNIFVFGNSIKNLEKLAEGSESKIMIQPSAPANFSVNRTDDRWDSITFNWSPSVGATSYKIYWQRKTVGIVSPFSGNRFGYKLVSGTTITLTNIDLPTPMNYYLYVTAIDSSGESLPSNLILYDAPPATPTNLVVTPLSSTSIKLSWDKAVDSDEVIGYYIYAQNHPAAFVGVSTPTVTLTDLTPNSVHTFSVEAIDIYMNSSFTAFDNVFYCTPTNGLPAANSCITNISLGASSNETTYNGVFYTDYSQDFSVNDYYIYKNSSYNTIAVTVAPTDPSGKPDSNLNTNVYAYIDYNHDGVFSGSELISFGNLSVKSRSINVPLTFLSNPFQTPSASLTGNTEMRVIVQRNALAAPTPNPCLVTGQGEVENYLLYVGAGWNRGTSQVTKPTNKVMITLSGEKIENVSDDDLIQLYPNPLKGDLLNITNVENNTQYTIVNTLGQNVGSGIIENNTIKVEKLPIGTYFLQLEHNNEKITKQFIKQ